MEVWYPLYRFREAGAQVVTVGAEAGETYTSKLGYRVKCERSYDEVSAVAGGHKQDVYTPVLEGRNMIRATSSPRRRTQRPKKT